MYSFVKLFSAVTMAVSIAQAYTVPTTYVEGYLESYGAYHTRYLALDCEAKHNTSFFASCCHPLLATESESSLPSECSTTSTTTSTAASSTSTSSSSEVYTGGYATYYYQDGVAGACGTVHSDSDYICAMDEDRYGDSGGVSSLCGQQVTITNTDNGKSVTVTIADDCPSCDNENSIDLSVAAFEAIADLSTGIVPIDWVFA